MSSAIGIKASTSPSGRSLKSSSNATMASRSSRPRRTGPKGDRRGLYGRLLRQGGRFPDPGPDLREAAAELEALGLILLRRSRAVLCANPEDRDFPPFDPDCTGVIELRQTADEGGGDYACPMCDRSVYPILKAKAQIDLLTASLDQRGIERFVADLCGDAAAGQAFEAGVLVIPDRPQNRFICILDFCTDPNFLTPEWIGNQPCVYVSVDPRMRARLGSRPDTRHVELVELVVGGATLNGRADQGSRSTAHGGIAHPHPRSDRAAASLSAANQSLGGGSFHKFTVALVAEGVMVDGIVIECDPNGVPYLSFIELMQQAITDVAGALDISPLTAKAIVEKIRAKLPAGAAHPDTVQKGLKRLDRKIVRRLRQEARLINEGDIIENVARARKYRGRHGFRLNSDRIAIDPRTPKRS